MRVGDAVTDWVIYEGDYRDVLSTLGTVDVAIWDPPYSEQVHKSVRSAKRSEMPDVADFECRTRRVVDLGFEHLQPEDLTFLADWCGANVKRWSAVFSDVESCHLWREGLTAAGLDYIRTGAWHRIGGAPQFTGDRPASGFEAVTICHPKGRKRWNGGGHAALWSHPIVANRLGQRGSRCHPTQKPESLMLELVSLFSDPGETVIDFTCGSSTTGVACLRLGRKFIGIERDPEHAATARQRLEAEGKGLTLAAHRAGQESLFGGEP